MMTPLRRLIPRKGLRLLGQTIMTDLSDLTDLTDVTAGHPQV